MLHHTMDIIKFCLIAYPCFFLVMAGLDLMLRIAGAFASTSTQTQIEQAIEDDVLPAHDEMSQPQPVVATSPETQTEKAVELEPVSLLQTEPVPPTSPELKPTCPELKSPQQPTETPLSQLKRYKLHGHEVVPVSQLSITIPASVKRYKLRGMAVVRVSDIA